MKLYDVPRNTVVRTLEYATTPPGGYPVELGDILTLHHIDGMYSLCSAQDGGTRHPAARTEVEGE